MTKYALIVAALVAALPRPAAADQKGLEKDMTHLLFLSRSIVAADDYAWENPYVRGFIARRKGDEASAKSLFGQAIRAGSFTSASRYMLAYMDWRKHQADGYRGDLSAAYSRLDGAIKDDPDYAAAYYLRGLMRWNDAHEAKSALSDLARAAQLGAGSCRDINDPKELENWRRPDTKEPLPGIERVRQDCAKTHHLKAETPSGRPAP